MLALFGQSKTLGTDKFSIPSVRLPNRLRFDSKKAGNNILCSNNTPLFLITLVGPQVSPPGSKLRVLVLRTRRMMLLASQSKDHGMLQITCSEWLGRLKILISPSNIVMVFWVCYFTHPHTSYGLPTSCAMGSCELASPHSHSHRLSRANPHAKG